MCILDHVWVFFEWFLVFFTGNSYFIVNPISRLVGGITLGSVRIKDSFLLFRDIS